MALQMGGIWPAAMVRIPPGFEESENQLWQRYLAKWGMTYEGFYYNVKLGKDRVTEEERKDPIKKMREEIQLKRIDAIGVRANRYELIEVRKNAGPGTLGQIIMYESLWAEYGLKDKASIVCVVSDYMDIDIQLAAKNANVTVILI